MTKFTITRVALLLAAGLVCVSPALAQRQLGKKKGPTSKLYLAETVGDGQIITEGRAYKPRQATAFDAPGTVIETSADSHQAFVYSNGTGMYVDASTRVEINRFVQEPFLPDRHATDAEPSISQSDVFVSRGQIGICTGQLVSGTTMNYSTPHAGVAIRGGKLAIETNSKETIISLLEGDATVRAGTRDSSGALLRPGERAVIRPGPPGQPAFVTVSPIDRQVMADLDDKVNVACNAKKTVSFETIARKSEDGAGGAADESTAPGSNTSGDDAGEDGEIVARPTVPEAPPTNIVVSPAQIESGPGK